jgi:hypothetical protein
MPAMRTSLAIVVLIAAGCTTPAPPTTATYLTPIEHLARASLALRGVRPTLAELRAVAEQPDRVTALVDRYLEAPEFGATIRELHNELLRLHPQLTNFTPPPAPPLQGASFTDLNRAIYDEPLRLIEDVVMTDQPYTRIVTAGYTMADRTVATMWGMDHSDRDGWERTHWADDRGAAGILASTALYLRYRSVNFNQNRARANAISRSLLCHDFSESDIHIDTSVDLSNAAIVADAEVRNPSCAGCHQAMDPLASYFFGFHQGVLGSVPIGSYPVSFYHSDTEGDWEYTTGRPPGYFGAAPVGLAGLGGAIAADPRFARCAAINFASYLTEQPASALSPAWIARLQDGFAHNGFSAKRLARAIVLSDEFRRASDPDPIAAEGVVGYQKLRPAQLARMLGALTGFAWQADSNLSLGGWGLGRIDYLDDDIVGYRVLAGGTDSWWVTSPSHTMNATASLVTRGAARRAAAFAVERDADTPAAKRQLFTRASVDDGDPADVRAELAELHGRIFSELVDPDDPALDDSAELFAGALAASGDPRRAWVVTLTGMLSDLRAIYY